MKVKLHPLFFASIPLYVLFGGVMGYLTAFLAVTIHEMAHYTVARIAGAKELTLLLMPYGAVLEAKGEFPHFGWVLIAGPLANIILASFTLSACWIFPELYGYLKSFIAINVFLAALNLLPAYPLDGGRLLRLMFPAPWARGATCVMTFLLSGGALCAFIVTLRLTYLIFAAFLALTIVVTLFGRRNKVSEDRPLYSLAKVDEEGRLRPAIVKRGRKRLCRLTSAEVASLLISYPPSTPIGEAIKGKI